MFSNILLLGQIVNPRHVQLYNRVSDLYRKPVEFDTNFTRANGGMREFRESLRIWLNLKGPNPAYTLAHELAHFISAYVNDAPTMLSDKPPEGPTRFILGHLLSLVDHPKAHRILGECGFGDEVSREQHERSVQFLADVPTASWHAKGVPQMMSIGFAEMHVTYRDAKLLPKIDEAMQRARKESWAVGKIFAMKIENELTDASPDAVVNEVIEMARGVGIDARGMVQRRSRVFGAGLRPRVR